MRWSRFSETQTVTIANEADARMPVINVAQHAIRAATFYKWSKYVELDAADSKHMHELDVENAEQKSRQ